MAADKKIGTVRVTLVRGLVGKKPDHRATVRGLGLKWRMHSVEVQDTPQTRGMINKIGYMLRVTEAKG
ncbi:MAG TPA: 50S ribosomal protein L30 [Casimicrobiaceae bacterium]|jgi:large subunit ribosomal protein L30